jgi:diacylglycerol kinase
VNVCGSTEYYPLPGSAKDAAAYAAAVVAAYAAAVFAAYAAAAATG